MITTLDEVFRVQFATEESPQSRGSGMIFELGGLKSLYRFLGGLNRLFREFLLGKNDLLRDFFKIWGAEAPQPPRFRRLCHRANTHVGEIDRMAAWTEQAEKTILDPSRWISSRTVSCNSSKCAKADRLIVSMSYPRQISEYKYMDGPREKKKENLTHSPFLLLLAEQTGRRPCRKPLNHQ